MPNLAGGYLHSSRAVVSPSSEVSADWSTAVELELFILFLIVIFAGLDRVIVYIVIVLFDFARIFE
jgi:hypothetical protein